MTTTGMTSTGTPPAGWKVEFAQAEAVRGPCRIAVLFDLLRVRRMEGAAPLWAAGGGGPPGGPAAPEIAATALVGCGHG